MLFSQTTRLCLVLLTCPTNLSLQTSHHPPTFCLDTHLLLTFLAVIYMAMTSMVQVTSCGLHKRSALSVKESLRDALLVAACHL